MRRLYDLTAVFLLVKPRSWLNVKFRCSMISTLRSNFPTEPARGSHNGYTRGFPTNGVYTLKLQMESANHSSTTDESRVQLRSLEYDELRLA